MSYQRYLSCSCALCVCVVRVLIHYAQNLKRRDVTFWYVLLVIWLLISKQRGKTIADRNCVVWLKLVYPLPSTTHCPLVHFSLFFTSGLLSSASRSSWTAALSFSNKRLSSSSSISITSPFLSLITTLNAVGPSNSSWMRGGGKAHWRRTCFS